jgi:hypothetical protein
MVAYFTSLPFGIPGSITRPHGVHNVESMAFDPATPFPSYGVPGKVVASKFVPLTAVGDTQPYGFLVRPYPTSSPNQSDPFFGAVPPVGGVANVMTRGYMAVKCNAGTPAFAGTVYFRYANAAGGTPLGGLEATAVGGSNVALLNIQFMGAADSNGNVEVRFGSANQ